MVIDEFVDKRLHVAKLAIDENGNAEDGTGINQALRDVPQHIVGDGVLVEKETQHGEHDARCEHDDSR
jgi:hypothetical protein